MSKIAKLPGNCVLVVFKHLSDLDDERIIDVCKRWGYPSLPSGGMYESQWVHAARELGIKLAEKPLTGPDGFISAGTLRSRSPHPTLGQVAKRYKDGVYLVRTRTHVLILNRGVVVDTNYKTGRHARRRVYSMYRVLNPAIKPRPSRLPANPRWVWMRRPSKRNAVARRTYCHWLDLDQAPQDLDVVAYLGFTRKRLRHHLRRGDVALVD